MMLRLMDLMAAVALGGFVFIAWHLWGALAQRLGTGRLQLLGVAALLGWLLGH